MLKALLFLGLTLFDVSKEKNDNHTDTLSLHI